MSEIRLEWSWGSHFSISGVLYCIEITVRYIGSVVFPRFVFRGIRIVCIERPTVGSVPAISQSVLLANQGRLEC